MEKSLSIDILDVLAEPDTKIIKVNGELGMNNSNNLKIAAEEIIEKGITNLIIDLSNLRFIDSIGTLSLISIHIKTRRRSGNMCICGVNINIKDVFDTVGLAKLVPLCGSVSEAISSIKNKKGRVEQNLGNKQITS